MTSPPSPFLESFHEHSRFGLGGAYFFITVGGDGLWMDTLFHCESEDVVVRRSSELLLDYGIYLGPIGNEKKSSVISVSYGEWVTLAHIHTPKQVR